jgi:hypothetical protein
VAGKLSGNNRVGASPLEGVSWTKPTHTAVAFDGFSWQMQTNDKNTYADFIRVGELYISGKARKPPPTPLSGLHPHEPAGMVRVFLADGTETEFDEFIQEDNWQRNVRAVADPTNPTGSGTFTHSPLQSAHQSTVLCC